MYTHERISLCKGIVCDSIRRKSIKLTYVVWCNGSVFMNWTKATSEL